MIVCIAEKPSVAKDIARIIPSKYIKLLPLQGDLADCYLTQGAALG